MALTESNFRLAPIDVSDYELHEESSIEEQQHSKVQESKDSKETLL